MSSWQNVPKTGETPQAMFLREQVLPRLAWAVLGVAGWGFTALVGAGVWELNTTAQRYQEHDPIPQPPTVYERVIQLPEPKVVDKYRDPYVATLDGVLVTSRDLMSAAQTEHLKRDREEQDFKHEHGWYRRPCVGIPDGCFKTDKPSEIAYQAIALIAACFDFASLSLSSWLLWGAIVGREFRI